jgi:hypothetical protein
LSPQGFIMQPTLSMHSMMVAHCGLPGHEMLKVVPPPGHVVAFAFRHVLHASPGSALVGAVIEHRLLPHSL